MKRKTNEEFIVEARKVHGDKYVYEKTHYSGYNVKVTVICKKHGDFLVTPAHHLIGKSGCPRCCGKNKTTDSFVKECKSRHGDKYGYEHVVYTKGTQRITLVCRVHGTFDVIARNHLSGQGCQKCGKLIAIQKRRSNIKEFLKKAIALHGDKYRYDNAVYIDSQTKLAITCPTHGDFIVTPAAHLNGHGGCAKCGGLYKTTADFIKEASIVHGNRYIYSDTIYKNSTTKVIICCKKHGNFLTRPYQHVLFRSGCPKCRASKGEALIGRTLTQLAIAWMPQQSFNNCCGLSGRKLFFDVVVRYRAKMFLIEYQGQQHYYVPKKLGKKILTREEGLKALAAIKHRDAIKLAWCKKHGIPLLRIPYWRRNEIPELIKKFIGYSPELMDYEQLTIDS